MTIAYVGNRKNLASDGKSFNTENHIALTLEKLGHTVNFIQEDEIEPGTLPTRVLGADMFLWTRTWKESDGRGFVGTADLQEIKKMGIPTVSFHLDKYTGIQRDGGIGTDLFWKTDFVFSPEGSVQAKEIFKAHGINQFYLPPGVFEGECYMKPHDGDFMHDVVFVGGGADYSHPEWSYRAKLVKWLQDTYGDKFGKYGHPERTVRGKELNHIYHNSKIVIGDSLCKDFIDSFYYSDRCFETTGRGGFLIAPYIPGITDHYVDRSEIVLYAFDNFTQLKNLIDYYLEHDDEREAIRKAGFERTRRDNTYTNRMKELIDTVSATTAVPTPSVVAPTVPTGLTFAQLENAVDELDKALAEPIKINLGAGSEPTEGWVNVDWIKQPGIDVVQNLLMYPWCFDNEVADEIKAIDVLEHMPSFTYDYWGSKTPHSTPISFIEECWRILKPGGKLTIQVPHYLSPNLWIDPTHIRGYDPQSFDYFDPETDLGRNYGYYSDKKFKVAAEVSFMENQAKADNNGKPSNVTFVMEKVV